MRTRIRYWSQRNLAEEKMNVKSLNWSVMRKKVIFDQNNLGSWLEEKK